MNNLSKIPTLKSGDDAEAGKFLTEKFEEAQNGKRKIVACGLFAWQIKRQLKHGEFGPWLAAHAPKLTRIHSTNGRPQATDALQSFLDITRGVLATLGFTIEKYFAHISIPRFSGKCDRGDFLLLPDGKVPEEVKPLRDKICELIDGKTAKQLCLDFKQVEMDESGTTKPKRGRLKGQGGASKEQRAAAAAAEEKARIEAVELEADDFCKWIDDNCDEKGFGLINDKAFNKLCERAEFLWTFCRKLRDARRQDRVGQKGGAQ